MSNNWGTKFMLGATNAVNELFARFWTVVILFLVYSLFCAMLSSLTSLDPMIFFWGIPIIFFVFVVVMIGSSTVASAPSSGEKAKSVATLDVISEHGEHVLAALDQVLLSTEEPADSIQSMARILCGDTPPYHAVDELNNLECLYFAVVFGTTNTDIAKKFLSKAIYNQACHYNLRDRSAEIAGQLVDAKISGLSKDQEQAILQSLCLSYFMPRLHDKTKRFPTAMSLLNVRAIPVGSFLEKEATEKSNWLSQPVITDTIAIDELRFISEEFVKYCGYPVVDSFMSRSLAAGHKHAQKKIQKELGKVKLTATNLKTIRQQCAQLCFTSDYTDVLLAIDLANAAIQKVRAVKKTKALSHAIAALEDFSTLDKGISDEAVSEKISTVKKELYELIALLEQEGVKEIPNFISMVISLTDEIVVLPNGSLEREDYAALKALLVSLRMDIYDLLDEDRASEFSDMLIESIKKVSNFYE